MEKFWSMRCEPDEETKATDDDWKRAEEEREKGRRFRIETLRRMRH